MTTKKMVVNALTDALRRHGNGVLVSVRGEGTYQLYAGLDDGFCELREVSGAVRHRFNSVDKVADLIMKKNGR